MFTRSLTFKFIKFVKLKVCGIIFTSKKFFVFFETVSETPFICIDAFSTIKFKYYCQNCQLTLYNQLEELLVHMYEW